MRTIKTRGTGSEDGKLTADVPEDVAPGEHQILILVDDIASQDLTTIAEQGGAFDWLKDEPDLYTDEDGELVEQAGRRVAPQDDVLKQLGVVAMKWHGWPPDATFRRDQIYADDGR